MAELAESAPSLTLSSLRPKQLTTDDDERTFHPFPQLATELRLRIWYFARPDPYILRYPPLPVESSPRYKPGSHLPMQYRQHPAILHVNKESREVALKYYRLDFGRLFGGCHMSPNCHMPWLSGRVRCDSNWKLFRPVFFDRERDVLHIAADDWRLDWLLETHDFVNGDPSSLLAATWKIMENIENLAISGVNAFGAAGFLLGSQDINTLEKWQSSMWHTTQKKRRYLAEGALYCLRSCWISVMLYDTERAKVAGPSKITYIETENTYTQNPRSHVRLTAFIRKVFKELLRGFKKEENLHLIRFVPNPAEEVFLQRLEALVKSDGSTALDMLIERS